MNGLCTSCQGLARRLDEVTAERDAARAEVVDADHLARIYAVVRTFHNYEVDEGHWDYVIAAVNALTDDDIEAVSE
jgi:hypothetical protein